jgi:aryl-alcohol dehydrogenase-like predicted oxidoreductase
MRFGTATDEATSFAILDEYVAAGGAFLDTANVYAAWERGGKGGESEMLLARWFQARANRERIFLATKVGSRFQATGFGLKPEQIRREVDASLQRLGTDRIDLLYAHFEDRNTPPEETMATLEALVREGKARFLGASNHRAWRLEVLRALCATRGWTGYCCIQQRYSFFQPVAGASFGLQVAANDDLLDYCANRRMTLLAYSPLLGGVYGRSDKKPAPPYINQRNETRLAALNQLAAERGVTPNQLVLAWMLHHQPPVLPIAAASSVAQIRENLAAAEIVLSEDEMKRLNA